MNTKRNFIQNHKIIPFSFRQNKYDFIVTELPLQEFGTTGNNIILKIKKVFMTTWELLSYISDKLDIDEHKIGYAGLKDKNATTTQYISIPQIKGNIKKLLDNKQVEVLDIKKSKSKLSIGELKGNNFKITLHDVKEENITQIYQVLSKIQKHGIPNYFGYQRFGDDYNFERTKDVVYGEEVVTNKKVEHLLISAYQSYFFNSWLSKRVELSKDKGLNKLEILDGDLFFDKNKKIVTGLLPGRKVKRSTSKAYEIEKEFDDPYVHAKGYRREAWVKIENLKNKYHKDEEKLVLEFDLPKGSYATVVIENIANANFK
jgi:tRNA pseudouridine13 synthase